MKINLIRHGKTLANEKRLYCGYTDLPLSASGAEEILLLKQEGIYPTADVFFTSGLMRTEQTLDIIFGEVSRVTVTDIAEYNFGLFEMKSYDELKKRDEYQAWITDGTGNVQCPNGESKNQFEQRVKKGYSYIVNEVQQSNYNSAFVVCHGGTIACIMEYLFPKLQNFYEWQPEAGRGYTIMYDGESTTYNLI